MGEWEGEWLVETNRRGSNGRTFRSEACGPEKLEAPPGGLNHTRF